MHIYNAGVGGNLEEFPRVDFESLFNMSDDEKKNLLTDIELLKQRKIDFNYIQNNAKEFDANNELPDMFKTNYENGFRLIPKTILQYIPLGPYNNTYYFIKRPH